MMAQREQRLVPERVIGGKYKIIRLLGEGGMGGVYEAENELTHKRVAIKWLHPSLASSRDAVQRLLREAQACARVRHPHVVDVYDVGQEDDSIFLVMEYLEGETLRILLARRELPLDAMIGLLIPAMRGVAAVHAQGIIHRDIKPDNIFLARVPDYASPVPKVLDFGISKVDSRQGEMDTLTQSGVTMGTPLYMSFEQLSGAKDADARSDIYAFGVILYEAATGQPPFDADSFAALAVKVATTTPTLPRVLAPGIDPQLEAVIMKAMARDRAQRFASLDELIEELEPFATYAEPRASKPTRSRPSAGSVVPASAFAHTMPHTPQLSAGQDLRPKRRWLPPTLALVIVAGVAAYSYFRMGNSAEIPAAAMSPVSKSPAVTLEVNAKAEPVLPAALPPPATLPTVADINVAPAAAPAPSQRERARTSIASSRKRRSNEGASLSVVPAPEPAPVTPATPAAVETPPPAPAATDKGFRAGQPRLDQF